MIFLICFLALVVQLKKEDIDEPIITIKCSTYHPLETIAAADVAARIEQITDKIAPGKKINSHEKIELQISSKNSHDLTLIDLPGMAYSDGFGGGREVAERIKNLWIKYIGDDACVILCVVPANVDVGTQEVRDKNPLD